MAPRHEESQRKKLNESLILSGKPTRPTEPTKKPTHRKYSIDDKRFYYHRRRRIL